MAARTAVKPMPKPMSNAEQQVMKVLLKLLGGAHVALYRMTGGKIGDRMAGAPVMLLTTRGRKSGEPRTSPLLYLRDGDRVIVVASKGGHPKHPAWYLNLQANPEVEVQIGDEQKKMRAETASPERRAQYWQRLIAIYPPYQNYQERTRREIPVVVLRPV